MTVNLKKLLMELDDTLVLDDGFDPDDTKPIADLVKWIDETPAVQNALMSMDVSWPTQGTRVCKCHPNGMPWAGCPLHGGSR